MLKKLTAFLLSLALLLPMIPVSGVRAETGGDDGAPAETAEPAVPEENGENAETEPAEIVPAAAAPEEALPELKLGQDLTIDECPPEGYQFLISVEQEGYYSVKTSCNVAAIRIPDVDEKECTGSGDDFRMYMYLTPGVYSASTELAEPGTRMTLAQEQTECTIAPEETKTFQIVKGQSKLVALNVPAAGDYAVGVTAKDASAGMFEKTSYHKAEYYPMEVLSFHAEGPGICTVLITENVNYEEEQVTVTLTQKQPDEAVISPYQNSWSVGQDQYFTVEMNPHLSYHGKILEEDIGIEPADAATVSFDEGNQRGEVHLLKTGPLTVSVNFPGHEELNTQRTFNVKEESRLKLNESMPLQLDEGEELTVMLQVDEPGYYALSADTETISFWGQNMDAFNATMRDGAAVMTFYAKKSGTYPVTVGPDYDGLSIQGVTLTFTKAAEPVSAEIKPNRSSVNVGAELYVEMELNPMNACCYPHEWTVEPAGIAEVQNNSHNSCTIHPLKAGEMTICLNFPGHEELNCRKTVQAQETEVINVGSSGEITLEPNEKDTVQLHIEEPGHYVAVCSEQNMFPFMKNNESLMRSFQGKQVLVFSASEARNYELEVDENWGETAVGTITLMKAVDMTSFRMEMNQEPKTPGKTFGVRMIAEPINADILSCGCTWSVDPADAASIREPRGRWEIGVTPEKAGTFTISASFPERPELNTQIEVEAKEPIALKMKETRKFSLPQFESDTIQVEIPEPGDYVVLCSTDLVRMDGWNPRIYVNKRDGQSAAAFHVRNAGSYTFEISNNATEDLQDEELTLMKADAPVSAELKAEFDGDLCQGQYFNAYIVLNPITSCAVPAEMKIDNTEVAEMEYCDGSKCRIHTKAPGTFTLSATFPGHEEFNTSKTFTVPDPDLLICNEEQKVNLDTNERKSFLFTAPEDGTYTIYTQSNFEFMVNHFAGDFQACFGGEFDAAYFTMKAGQSATVGLRNWGGPQSGIIGVCPTPALEGISIQPVCDEKGSTVNYYVQASPRTAKMNSPVCSVDPAELADITEGSYGEFILNLKEAGTGTITVTDGSGVTASAPITVREPLPVLDIGQSIETELGRDESVKVTARISEPGSYFIYCENSSRVGANRILSGFSESVGFYFVTMEDGSKRDGILVQAKHPCEVTVLFGNRGKKVQAVFGAVKMEEPKSLSWNRYSDFEIPYYPDTSNTAWLTLNYDSAFAMGTDVHYEIEQLEGQGASIWEEVCSNTSCAVKFAGPGAAKVTAICGQLRTSCIVRCKDVHEWKLDEVLTDAVQPGKMEFYQFTAPEDGDYAAFYEGTMTSGFSTDYYAEEGHESTNDSLKGGGWFRMKKGQTITAVVWNEGSKAENNNLRIVRAQKPESVSIPQDTYQIAEDNDEYTYIVAAGNPGYTMDPDAKWTFTGDTDAVRMFYDCNTVAVLGIEPGMITATITLSNGKSASCRIEVVPAGECDCSSHLVKVPEKLPTFTEAGNREYWKCTRCGRFYEDAEGKHEITDRESVILPALVEVTEDQTAVVSPGAVDTMLEEAGTDQEMVLDLTELKETSVEVSFPRDKLMQAAEANQKGLTVSFEGADLTLDAEALRALCTNFSRSADNEVRLAVSTLTADDLTPEQKNALAGEEILHVVSAKAENGTRELDSLSAGKAKIRIHYQPEGSTEDCIISALDVSGNRKTVNAVYENGCFELPAECFGTYVITRKLPDGVPGDANGDGTANRMDAVLILQQEAGWNVQINESVSDVNGDGKVNRMDAVLILQKEAGWNVDLG